MLFFFSPRSPPSPPTSLQGRGEGFSTPKWGGNTRVTWLYPPERGFFGAVDSMSRNALYYTFMEKTFTAELGNEIAQNRMFLKISWMADLNTEQIAGGARPQERNRTKEQSQSQEGIIWAGAFIFQPQVLKSEQGIKPAVQARVARWAISSPKLKIWAIFWSFGRQNF